MALLKCACGTQHHPLDKGLVITSQYHFKEKFKMRTFASVAQNDFKDEKEVADIRACSGCGCLYVVAAEEKVAMIAPSS